MDEIKDINGNILNIGDAVHITKDLKVKGMPKGLKQGTKLVVRDISPFIEESIEVKIGKSTIAIKPEYLKKTQ